VPDEFPDAYRIKLFPYSNLRFKWIRSGGKTISSPANSGTDAIGAMAFFYWPVTLGYFASQKSEARDKTTNWVLQQWGIYLLCELKSASVFILFSRQAHV
jgi:hypothetical protein